MKSRTVAFCSFAATIAIAGCGEILAVDNYTQPESTLSGRVVYQGQPIGVRNRGVQLELWEPGWELNQKIPVHVSQDGSFQSRIFDGEYEINLLPGNGPWVNNPTRIPVSVSGQAVMDIEVEPYYIIRNEQITHADGRISATFDVGQINTSRAVEYLGLYVATTQFVDRINQTVRLERPSSQIVSLSVPITLSVTLPANIHVTPSPERRDHVFVRVGVKTVGVAELLFSPVYKIAI